MKNDVIRLLLTTCIVGAGAWWVQRSNASVELAIGRLRTAIEQPQPAPTMPGACAVSIDPRVLRSEVQRALSGVQLVKGDNSAPDKATTTADVEPEPEPGPTPEQVKGYDTANALIEAALKRKVWSSEDSQQLRPILSELDPQNREEIRLLLVRSMNEGKLEFTGRPSELF